MSDIEWTEETWNPVRGCKPVSPGCAHCYAEPLTARLEAMGHAGYAGLTKIGAGSKKRLWTGSSARCRRCFPFRFAGENPRRGS